jgi:hypothetical protein
MVKSGYARLYARAAALLEKALVVTAPFVALVAWSLSLFNLRMPLLLLTIVAALAWLLVAYEEARRRGRLNFAKAGRRAAVDPYTDLLPTITELRRTGHSLSAIAIQLNEQGHETRTGAAWTSVQVYRVLRRAA